MESEDRWIGRRVEAMEGRGAEEVKGSAGSSLSQRIEDLERALEQQLSRQQQIVQAVGQVQGWADRVDGELDEAAAARVMVQMEESPECRAFFDDARRYVRLHKDMADPERLEARIATLAGVVPAGAEAVSEAEQPDLVPRLATSV